MLRFDWSVLRDQKLDRYTAVWSDSNAVKMTTAEHDLTKVFQSCIFIFTIKPI